MTSHHPDCPARDFTQRPERCRCELMAALDLAEQGRRLAGQRDDLIAQGVDPAELLVPIHPEDT